jgi:hypothetical protein
MWKRGRFANRPYMYRGELWSRAVPGLGRPQIICGANAVRPYGRQKEFFFRAFGGGANCWLSGAGAGGGTKVERGTGFLMELK